MKKGILVVIALVIVAGIIVWSKKTPPPTPIQNQNQSISDGTIKFNYPADFGLAVTKEQVLVSSYIPPCNENFDYCFYYNGNDFKGTNFESAGIRISKRNDLKKEDNCLTTPPSGYPDMGGSSAKTPTYSASIFSPIGDAGAGHYASGEIYRVYLKQVSKCYELETRIGETQYANYPEGTIKKFNEAGRNLVYDKFRSILGSLEISSSSEGIVLPDSEN